MKSARGIRKDTRGHIPRYWTCVFVCLFTCLGFADTRLGSDGTRLEMHGLIKLFPLCFHLALHALIVIRRKANCCVSVTIGGTTLVLLYKIAKDVLFEDIRGATLAPLSNLKYRPPLK